MTQVIALNRECTDYGVYSTSRRGPFGTFLLFRGTLDECLGWRRQQST